MQKWCGDIVSFEVLDRLDLEMKTYKTKDKALDVLYQIVERS